MPLDDQEKIEALRLHAQGLGGRLIARELGVPYGRVRRWLEKATYMSVATGHGPETVELHYGPPPQGPLFRVVTFDLECTNLKTDLGVLVCAAFHDMHTRRTVSRTLDDFGDRRGGEKQLALWIRQQVEAADVIVGFNSDGFDHHYVNGVLSRHGERHIEKRLIIDLYQTARYGWTGLPSSYSLRNLSHFFRLEHEKTSMDKDVWRQALTDPDALAALRRHCERDAEVTAELWRFMRPFHFKWRGK